MRHLVLFAAFALLLAAPTFAQGKVEVPFFGNETCPIMGKPVNKSQYAEKDGERVYTCCKKCTKKVKGDFDTYKAKAYPTVKKLGNAKCPLMSQRDAKADVKGTFQGHELNFCCKRCLAAFKAEPRKALYLATHEGITQAKNKKCPLMEEEDVVPDLFAVYGGHMVSLCCESCVDDFIADPDGTLKKLGLTAKKAEKKGDDDKKGN